MKRSIYKQGDIVVELERRLDSGFYNTGFPVGAVLAVEFGVNIKTINKAVNQLVDSGRLGRKRGVGTFVLNNTSNSQIEVLFEGYSGLFEHPFWGDIWSGCISRLLDADYRPVLTRLTADDATGGLDTGGFQFSASAGRLLLGITQPDFLKLVREQGVPAVSAGDEVADKSFPQVCFDYGPGIRDAVDYLRKMGCRRIAFIGETVAARNPKLLNKFQAFRAACDAFEAEHARPLPGAAAEAMRKLLLRTVPDAVFVSGDHQVPEVRGVLAERGISPLIVGCDGLAFADWPTVALPRREAGEAAAELLISLLRGDAKSIRIVLPSVFSPGK